MKLYIRFLILFLVVTLGHFFLLAAKKPETPVTSKTGATNAVATPGKKALDEEAKKAAEAEKLKTIGGIGGGGKPYPVKAEDPDLSWQKFTALDLAKIRAASTRIDAIIEKINHEKKVTPLPLISDEVFVRRASLDIAGRIPSPTELKNFLNSTSKNKREEYILSLLNSESYVNHQFTYWADLLRIEPQPFGQKGTAYPEYVKQAFRDNMPYDAFVKSLITADGWTTDTNGATGFILRDMRQGVLDHVSQIATVFLGSQIGCAMCHDAKFEKWKQTNFYALTAYFSEINLNKDQATLKELRIREKEAKGDPKLIDAINRESRMSPYYITDRPGKEQKLPADYKYDEALRGTVIKPNVLYGQTPVQQPNESRRSAFARWLTSKDNPNFTKNIANRYWANMFGIGLVEPVDDLSDNNEPSSKELLEEITKTMTSLNYNLKAFVAVLANTKLYQRTTSPKSVNFELFAFDSHPLRRLSAQQFYDSLVTLYVGDKILLAEPKLVANFESSPIKYNNRNGNGENLGGSESSMMQEHASEMKAKAQTMEFNDSTSLTSIPMSDSTMGVKLSRRELYEQKLKASRNPVAVNASSDTMMGSSSSMQDSMMTPGSMEKVEVKPTIQKLPIPLSSSMGTPREGGFLDQFGASLRDVVNTGTVEPNITQTLTLMNGQELLKITQQNAQNSLVTAVLTASENRDPAEIIDVATWRILGRKPTSSEIEIFTDFVKTYPASRTRFQEITSDLIWSLLNTREFLFYR